MAEEITRLLHGWRAGDRDSSEALIPLVHAELRRLAGRAARNEHAAPTMQPTALVNEAYLRLAGTDVDWQDRAHFFALAARLMKRILVDHARARLRERRGGGAAQVQLTEIDAPAPGGPIVDVLAVNEALERLRAFDGRKADVIELHYFGGMNQDEIAEVLGVSPRTVFQDLKLAKAWMAREMNG